MSVTPLSAVRIFAAAMALYSRWPMPARVRAAARGDELAAARARGWLPFVGLTVALPASVAYALCGLALPHAVAVLMAMLVALLLSGAVHERGLALWVDQAEVSRSGHAGAPAVIAVAMLLLARLEILSTIDPLWIGVTLVCAAAFSRG